MNELSTLLDESPIVWAILGAELAFWIFLSGGLIARYLLRKPRLSSVLLILVPVVDLVLVSLVAVDLAGGGEPTTAHRLAVVYLGVTVAFGHRIIRSADGWFAWRFAGAPKPAKKPTHGPAGVRHSWRDWKSALYFGLITVPGLLILQWVSGWQFPASWDQINELPTWSWALRVTAVVVIWFVVGPLYTTLFRASEPHHRTPVSAGDSTREQ